MILAGRGWGKTRTSSETCHHWVRTVDEWAPEPDQRRIAIAGRTSAEARDILVEGESGILATAPPHARPEWRRHIAQLQWPNGVIGHVLSADEPDRFRGYQFGKALCDELGTWRYPSAWDMLTFGLRLGLKPQVLISTTPQPTELIKSLVRRARSEHNPTGDVHLTQRPTTDNTANLAPGVVKALQERYGGTRLGRQELEAAILDDVPGALWRREEDIDRHRRAPSDLPEMSRIVVAIDPAVSTATGCDETGIIAAGIGVDGRGYVLEDQSGVYGPDEWARIAVALFDRLGANEIVAEKNQGGDMVKSTLKTQWTGAPVRLVSATRGKFIRAEPISALYVQGRVSHAGAFPELEDQMCNFTRDGSRKERSPDRLDAMVWALTHLFPSMAATNRIDTGNNYDALRGLMSTSNGWLAS